MDIKELIKEHHGAMVAKGFYDCPKCNGKKSTCNYEHSEGLAYCLKCKICPTCKGSGINPNKNIGELLMLIVSEMSEALEAHRIKKFADWDGFKTFIKEDFNLGFESCIKDTLGDEIADVILRIADICGYLKLDLYFDEKFVNSCRISGNVGEDLYCILLKLPSLNTFDSQNSFNWAFTFLSLFCTHYHIDIEKHINLKAQYNLSRPRKHGKDY